MNPTPPDDIIRISKEEATSGHVDDLLKRQMSLRGEPGVTRDRGRRWYYQTWFVLMLVGMLGAIAAGALIEPFFYDMLYLQGPISAIKLEDELPRPLEESESAYRLRRSVIGSITIKGEKIFLLERTQEIRPNGSKHRLDPEGLHIGEIVGVYPEYFPALDYSVAIAFFVERTPKPQSPSKAG